MRTSSVRHPNCVPGEVRTPARGRAWLALALSLLLALAPALSGCGLADAVLGPELPQISGSALEAEEVPAYEGFATAEVDGGEPSFTQEEVGYALSNEGFESYSRLDSLGRCGAATACVGPETMPAAGEERSSISEVRPSGWHSSRYDFVDGESLYNRCHLVGWQLSAENANERNLVTGTRSMNAQGMLPYENEVAEYVDRTGNHVLYRATPIFSGDELVCRGVQMEALSLEDGGEGVSFNVFCYNVEPGVDIDYATGDNAEDPSGGVGDEVRSADRGEEGARDYVLNTNTMRFHDPGCPSVTEGSRRNMREWRGSRDELVARGYEPCGRCDP